MIKERSDFRGLLRDERDAKGKRYTITKIAEGIYAGRAHVNLVLLNYKANGRPNFGVKTRAKLVRFFKANFKTWPAMLAALGWDQTGKIKPTVPQGTFSGEQNV